MKFREKTLLHNKKNKGFTLVEVIISMAILGIALSMVFSLNSYGTKLFKKSNDTSVDQYNVKAIAEFITKQLRYSKNVVISNDTPAAAEDMYAIYLNGSSDIIYNKGTNATSIPGVDGSMEYTLGFKWLADDMLQFTVGKKGTDAYDLTTKVKLLNIYTESPYKIQGVTDGSIVTAVTYKLDPSKVIQSIANISASVTQHSAYTMPATVTATMADGLLKSFPVAWSPSSINTSIIGQVKCDGTVDGTVYPGLLTVTVTASSVTINKIDPITDTINQDQEYTFPSMVVATMSDNSTQSFHVDWISANIDKDTETGLYKTGVYKFSGTVNGTVYADLLTVTVISSGGAVYAAPDQYYAKQNVTFSVEAADGVLKNDTGSNLQAAYVTGSGPYNGTLERFHSDGSFTYTPNNNYIGTDTFQYTASPGSSQATVYITVTGKPAQPAMSSTVVNNYNSVSFGFSPSTDLKAIQTVKVITNEGSGTATASPYSDTQFTISMANVTRVNKQDTISVTLTVSFKDQHGLYWDYDYIATFAFSNNGNYNGTWTIKPKN